MSTTYKRVVLEIQGDQSVTFFPAEAHYSVSRASNSIGRRSGEAIVARLRAWVDAQDTTRLSQESLLALWDMATESKDPLYRVICTWYKDDADDVLGAVEFRGWVSSFTLSNPPREPDVNNLFEIEFTVTLDEDNVRAHKMTN